MKTALDAPTSKLDDAEIEFVDNIREHGWFRTSVLADEEGPSFAYSTGFWVSAGAPEIMTFAMKNEIVHDVLWGLFHDAKAGKNLPVGLQTNDIFGNSSAYLLPVSKDYYAEYLGWSRWFYRGDEFPCLQLVWPDRDNRFPWEMGFDPEFEGLQPDLTKEGWTAHLGQ